jgi:hypothetical protein
MAQQRTYWWSRSDRRVTTVGYCFEVMVMLFPGQVPDASLSFCVGSAVRFDARHVIGLAAEAEALNVSDISK